MDKIQFLQYLSNKKILISDGATGSNLIRRGLPSGLSGEHWIIENPMAIKQLHLDFINAGADIILTCTFGGSEPRLAQSDLAEKFETINSKAVELAKEAVTGKDILVAGSVGPLGEMLEPYGSIKEKEAQEYYLNQMGILADSGVDLIVIETQFDLKEALIAIQAAQKVANLAIICSFSFDRGIKTMMGVSPAQFAKETSQLNLAAIGINCGKSLEDNKNALNELARNTDKPIWFKPNAGLPTIDGNGQPIYNVDPADMASEVPDWVGLGAQIIGGCCGTSPKHLKSIAAAAKQN